MELVIVSGIQVLALLLLGGLEYLARVTTRHEAPRLSPDFRPLSPRVGRRPPPSRHEALERLDDAA